MREWLKELRERGNLTQTEIANSLELSQNYYSNIENGERQKDLDLSLVIKLAKIFNVSVDYIIAEEEKLRR
jgi:transcriptional regulator with XRE-family HTH domain